jgi:hypothetical protein
VTEATMDLEGDGILGTVVLRTKSYHLHMHGISDLHIPPLNHSAVASKCLDTRGIRARTDPLHNSTGASTASNHQASDSPASQRRYVEAIGNG